MSVGKLSSNRTLETRKSSEATDPIDTLIRQNVGKDIFLPFSWARDSSMHWIQLLHSLDHSDMSVMPLLTPVKVQMQKCERCSREFCSSYNLRRHARVHTRVLRRSSNGSKELQKNRELLAAFWDKLSSEKAKDVISFNDVMLLKGLAGSTVITALAASLCKPGGVWSLPQAYAKAGSTLLDIVHASELGISSKELFSVLDDASERTFLCTGTVDFVQKCVFEVDDARHCLELKNVISTASFLFEKQLVKAWFDDKDAEALRCQNLLVEEEEAAQKRQAVLLERKRQKKLRQKEQKLRERLNESPNAEADSVDTPDLAQESAPPPPSSDSKSDSPDLSVNLDSRSESLESQSKKPTDDTEHKGQEHPLIDELEVVGANGPRRSAPVLHHAIRSESYRRNGFRANHQVDTPDLAQESAPPPPSSDSKSDSPDLSVNLDSRSESLESQSKKPTDNTEHKDQEHPLIDELKVVGANGPRRSAPVLHHVIRSESYRRNGFRSNHQVDTPDLAEESAPPPPSSDSKSDSPDLSVNLDSISESLESQSKKPTDNTERKDQEHPLIDELKVVGANGPRRSAPVLHHAIRSESYRRNGFRANHQVDTPDLAQESAPPPPSYDSKSDSPDLSVNLDSRSESLESQIKKPTDDTKHKDQEHPLIDELKVVGANGPRRSAPVLHYAIRSQSYRRNGFRANHHNVSKQKVWTKKPTVVNSGEESSKPSQLVVVEDTRPHQEEEDSYEVMIVGSISVPLRRGVRKQQDKGTVASKPRDTCNAEHPVLMNGNSEKPMKTTSGHQSGASRVGSKQWRPVSRGDTKSTLLPVDRGQKGLNMGPTTEKVQGTIRSSDESSVKLQPTDNDGSLHHGNNDLLVPEENLRGNMPFSSAAAREFLARRWKQALASEHVVLDLSPRPEQSSHHDEEQNVPTSTENKLGRNSRAKFRRKKQNKSKIKDLPKQKAAP